MNDKNINIDSYKELSKQIGNLVISAVSNELEEYTDKYALDDFLERYKGTTDSRAVAMISIAADYYKNL